MVKRIVRDSAWLAVLGLLPAFLACSSSTTSSQSVGAATSTVNGEIGGGAFTPANVFAGFSTSSGLLYIGLSSTLDNACNPACVTDDALEISVPSSLATPGTYNIGEQETAAFGYVNLSCPSGGSIAVSMSTTGTVTLTTVTATSATGSFDITFGAATGGSANGPGGELTGQFQAVACP